LLDCNFKIPAILLQHLPGCNWVLHPRNVLQTSTVITRVGVGGRQ
jgi:hypothetical protein